MRFICIYGGCKRRQKAFGKPKASNKLYFLSRDGSVVLFRWASCSVFSMDQSEGLGIRDSTPEMDLRLPLSPPLIRHL